MRRTEPDALTAARLCDPIPDGSDPAVEALVHDIIGVVADKWTMLILEILEERGTLRFTELGRHVGGISQKMLTQTVRQMERDGLVCRTVHPVIPPRVDYALTDLGRSLGAAFCGVWIWAETHREAVERSRAAFAGAGRRGAAPPLREARARGHGPVTPVRQSSAGGSRAAGRQPPTKGHPE